MGLAVDRQHDLRAHPGGTVEERKETMKYAIINYKRMTRANADSMPEMEDAEARLPIVRQDGDAYYCSYPDGRIQVLHIQQIAAFYDSVSGMTLSPQQMQNLREQEWLP